MKKDIILCGVGGQGILSIATIIGEAATRAGVNLKQAEVHGMSQRGGDVQSNLRLSSKDGVVVTSNKPLINVPNYPEEKELFAELSSLNHVVQLDIEEVAKDAGSARSANVVLLGMAAKFLEIVSPEALRDAVATIFSKKGEQIVESNLKAFDMGANVH